MSGADLFLMIIILIPIYTLLIWAYINPKASYLFGRRWMYKEEPEFTEETIKFFKMSTMIFIVIITFVLVLFVYGSFNN